MLRKLFIVVAVGFLLIPQASRADTTAGTVPEFNPLCWKKDECACERAKLMVSVDCRKMSDADKLAGWITGEKPCDQEGWGKCLPAGQTKTEITFGGKKQFANVGEFIQLMYRYLIAVAGILAAVMMIVAGLQWVTSGGNSEAITSAKKRIGGALMGVFLAYLSYFILAALNPALVRFRLPQIWMLRPSHLLPEYCGQVSSSVFALAAENTDQDSAPPPIPADFSEGKALDYTKKQDEFKCGRRFYVRDAGGQTCFGDVCNPGAMCTNFDLNGKIGPRDCLQASVAGKITNDTGFKATGCLGGLTPFGADGWKNPEIVDTTFFNKNKTSEEELWLICKDNSLHEIGGEVASTIVHKEFNGETYHMSFLPAQINQAVAGCADKGGERGFVIKFEMNTDCDSFDQDHWVGYDGNFEAAVNSTVDLGYTSGWGETFGNSSFKNGDKLADFSVNIDDRYFIPAAKLKKGMILNMDATKIYTITKGADEYPNVYRSIMKSQ